MNIQATSKGSDQNARMRRLIWAFAGSTYHIVGNLMATLIFYSPESDWQWCWSDSTVAQVGLYLLVHLQFHLVFLQWFLSCALIEYLDHPGYSGSLITVCYMSRIFINEPNCRNLVISNCIYSHIYILCGEYSI